jgi:hypothetical protein
MILCACEVENAVTTLENIPHVDRLVVLVKDSTHKHSRLYGSRLLHEMFNKQYVFCRTCVPSVAQWSIFVVIQSTHDCCNVFTFFFLLEYSNPTAVPRRWEYDPAISSSVTMM